jgi:threonine/homoserine/homoserine lactone efflux protein
VLFQVLLVHLAAIASPGPNVLLVAHTSLARSRRAGLWAAAGIATGALAWAAIVAGGLALLLDGAPTAQAAIRVAGGLYLVVLGVRTFRAAHARLDDSGSASRRGDWTRGVLTNLSNPKAGVFYVSIFGAMLPPTASPGLRAAAVAVIFANALAWHAVIALGMSAPGSRSRYLRNRGWIDRVAGVVIATFGLLLATGLR